VVLVVCGVRRACGLGLGFGLACRLAWHGFPLDPNELSKAAALHACVEASFHQQLH